MDDHDGAVQDHRPAAMASAIDIMSRRWALSLHAAEMMLCDMASETGVEVADLAELISNAKRNNMRW